MPDSSPTITSRDNPVYKRIRSLQRSAHRNAERAFLVEGVRAVLDGIQAGFTPTSVLLSPEFDIDSVMPHLESIPVRRIARPLLESLSDTVTSQGILAVFPFPILLPSTTSPELTLVADGIADPGNLGSLLRSAAAAAANRVLITPGTVDPYSPKVVRSAMGAHFRVPIERLEPAHVIPEEVIIVLLTAASPTVYTDVELTGPVWIVTGSEAHGIRCDFGSHPTRAVSLPMPGNAESLNAAIAGSIVLYEALRQRSHSI